MENENPLAGKRILAVANWTRASMLKELLEKEGYFVDIAKTGATAESMAFKMRPDAIVIDLALPDKSGINVCAAVKGNPATAKTPVIFYTATPMGTLMQRQAEAAGGTDFLTFSTPDEHLLLKVAGAVLRAELNMPDRNLPQ